MRLRFFVVSLLLAFLLLGGTAFSQTFTGLFDGYYAFNFNKPANQFNTERAFDINHQMFSLNYAELSIEQKPKPVGFRFDLGFGDAASIVNSTEPAGVIYQHVQQAYLSLNRDKMTIDMGKFVTPLGAEVIETKDNWNYSRGLLFTYAIPFYHFGVRTTYAASDKATVAAYVVNGWNNVRDNNKGKSIGLMTTIKPINKLTMTENYLVGNESPVKDNRRHTFDSIATYEFDKGFSMMGNFDYAFDSSFSVRRHWIGGAGYIKYSPNKQDTGVKILPRYEWFKDPNGISGISQLAQEGTITIQYVSKESGTFWTEYRRDWSSQRVFSLNKASGNVPRFNQDTLEFGYTYAWTHESK
jgi:hypothetical protein